MAQPNSAANSAPGSTNSSLSALRARADYAERVKEVTNRIHAAHDLDELLVSFSAEILGLFDAERLRLYAIDTEKNELYSRSRDADKIHEKRLLISDQSLAGFVARHKQTVNITDVYNTDGLG